MFKLKDKKIHVFTILLSKICRTMVNLSSSYLTLFPEGVVQSPFLTTPKDPFPSFPYSTRALSLIRQVRAWSMYPENLGDGGRSFFPGAFSCPLGRIYRKTKVNLNILYSTYLVCIRRMAENEFAPPPPPPP